MTETQQYLIELIKSTLSNSKPRPPVNENFDWKAIIKLSEHQDLLGILYPAIKEIASEDCSVPVMQEWRERIMANGAMQSCLTDDLLTTLKALNESGIPYVAFKGMALKHLYPYPELRHMSDLDLLVPEPDVSAMEETLTSLGYQTMEKSRSHGAHIVLTRQSSFPIELHRSLWNTDLHEKVDILTWEKHIWKNKRLIHFNGTDLSVLSAEDELINLVLHFSSHFIYASANLRQIYDIALLLRQYSARLDYVYIIKIADMLCLKSLLISILSLCSASFGIACGGEERGNNDAARKLMQDVLSNYGVHKFAEYNKVSWKLYDYYQGEILQNRSAERFQKARVGRRLKRYMNQMFNDHLSLGAMIKKIITTASVKFEQKIILPRKVKSIYNKRLSLFKQLGLIDEVRN